MKPGYKVIAEASSMCMVSFGVCKLKVLVTGAGGLLGREVCAELSRRRCEVYAIIRPGATKHASGIEYIELDLADLTEMSKLPEGVDAVLHLAQSEKYQDFPNSALDIFNVNVLSTARLLDYCSKKGIRKFILASSGGIYQGSDKPILESNAIGRPDKLGYYLGGKASIEFLSQSYADVFDVICLRPFFVYGAGQKRQMLLPRLKDSVRNGKEITIAGDCGLVINPIHVKDAAVAFVESLFVSGSRCINVAGSKYYSLKQICDHMAEEVGCSPNYSFAKGDGGMFVADISLMKSILCEPKYDLLECLHEI